MRTISTRCLLLATAAHAPLAAALQSLRAHEVENASWSGLAVEASIGLTADRSCSPGQPRIPKIDPYVFQEVQNEQEINQWWQQPIKKCEHAIDHFELDYVPKDLRAFFESHAPDQADAPAQYTHAWRHDNIVKLLVTWKHLMTSLGVQYWLNGGALLSIGRYHGKHLIPWDVDADVAMTAAEFEKLNATLFSSLRRVPGKISPGELGLPPDVLVQREINGKLDQRIPARMIHTGSGLYLDVFGTFVKRGGRYNYDWPGVSSFAESDIFPLVPCVLEGAGHLPCPHNAKKYNDKDYPNQNSPDHRWNPATRRYEPSLFDYWSEDD